MDLIVTHIGADFDALASLAAAKKIYPKALTVLPGSPDKDVREYLYKNPHLIELERENKVDFKKVKRLIIVDTRLAKRVGEAKNALNNPGLILHFYDHHPRAKGDLTGAVDIGGDYGATTTILVELLRKRRIKISPEEATLLALGIYEDTGSFTFPSTTPSDLKAASFLMTKGANLNVLSDFMHRELTKSQVELLNRLLRLEKRIEINGIEITIINLKSSDYIADLAATVHRLRDIENLDTIFVLLETKGRIRMVARSRIKSVDVGKVAQALGGGGHATAASATIRGMELKEVEKKLIEVLKTKVTSKITPDKSLFSKKNVAPLLNRHLPSRIASLLGEVGRISEQKRFKVFLVGGFVRDLLLGVKNFDIDLVVEGNGISFARALVERLGGKVTAHKRFATAVATLRDGIKIDIATARKEFYEFPAALPTIEESSVREDLYRRDFTINAMAVRLNPKRYGELVDFFGGWKDLKERVVRVLHKRSFIDDPTRIFRAIRFEGRYGFSMDRNTERLARAAVKSNNFGRLSKQRLREEIIAILSEPEPKNAILRLGKFGILRSIHPKIRLSHEMEKDLERVKAIFSIFTSLVKEEAVERWIVHFLILVQELSTLEVKNLCKNFRFSREQDKRINRGRERLSETIGKLKESELKPSFLYRTLKGLSLEVLLFIVLKARSRLVEKRISLNLTRMLKARIHTTGDKLKRMGYKEGPIFKKIMEELLWAKLDGIVGSPSSEVKFVVDNFPKD
jgi:tRNA nucleotidyltransferase/poly(A) polymerase/nanoRNase/pAp phosphatase (c-di-AMP/oligoRNAs hydrolase)